MGRLCTRFGFDRPRRDALLRLIGLTRQDERRLEELHRRAIGPNSERVIEAFYARLRDLPDFVRILAKAKVSVESLERTQHDYVRSLGTDFRSAAYFERRLRVGLVHAQVGVPASLYLGSYRQLQQLLIETIPRDDSHEALTGVLLRVMALDAALAMETYHAAQVEQLEASVQSLRVRREHLLHDLNTDALTGLASRRQVMSTLREALRAHRDSTRHLGIIMLDVDHFKAVNDRYGHGVGDRILHAVARRVSASVREVDTVGRVGGEEFLIVLPGADLDTILAVAERIRRHVATSLLQANGQSIRVTVSQGVAEAGHGEGLNGLLERSDAALYRAKRDGRGCVRVDFDGGLRVRVGE